MKHNNVVPTIEEKMRCIPHVFYFNLDHETDRRYYMENQFNYYNIKHTRVSQTTYLVSEIDKWINKVNNPTYPFELLDIDFLYHLGSLLTHIDLFKDWINNTNEDYLIIMEDDYDLSLIEYWHFTWEYLMKRLPYDWDCLQFSFETDREISFFLHPRDWCDSGFGAMMLTRHYVKKILKILHDSNGKVIVDNNIGMHKNAVAGNVIVPQVNHIPFSIDNCIGSTGVTYRLPLVTMNYLMHRDNKISDDYSCIHFFYCEQIVKKWWKQSRDNFSLNEFFTFGKANDHLMRVSVNPYNAMI